MAAFSGGSIMFVGAEHRLPTSALGAYMYLLLQMKSRQQGRRTPAAALELAGARTAAGHPAHGRRARAAAPSRRCCCAAPRRTEPPGGAGAVAGPAPRARPPSQRTRRRATRPASAPCRCAAGRSAPAALAIRAVHRRDLDDGRARISRGRRALAQAATATEQHPAMREAGYVHDAQKEYAEASLTLAYVDPRARRPTPRRSPSTSPRTCNGMVEAASELRRAGARPPPRRRRRRGRGAVRGHGRRLRPRGRASTTPTRSPGGSAAPPTRSAPCSSAPAATSPTRSSSPASTRPSSETHRATS